MSEKNTITVLENGLSDLTAGLQSTSFFTPQINSLDSVIINNRYNLLFNNRNTLSELYIEHGLVQTLIDQPVDDAFRNGIEIRTEQLDEDNIAEIYKYMDDHDIWRAICQTFKWQRLFGGAGIVINTDQNPETPFSPESIMESSRIEFYPADLWELNLEYYTRTPFEDIDEEMPYMFYGKQLHKSRVLKVKGKEAPSLFRQRFRGWGMSEVERVIRSYNQYLKNNNLIFELLDEAKLDVYKIQGFNAALATNNGTQRVQQRIQSANEIKNFNNAITMDKEDEYEQKQMAFAGLADMLDQIRMNIASDLKMPLTKLFGVSSAGFNSGEDDIENYNSMIETEVRSKAKPLVIAILQIICQKLFEFIPDDINFEFPPLRMLSSEQEQNVKNAKLDRIMIAFQNGIITPEEAREAINHDEILSIDVEVTDEIYEIAFNQGGQGSDFVGMNEIPESGKQLSKTAKEA